MFISMGSFAANQGVKVKIDGVTLKTDVPAQVVNGRTLVPLRALFEEYGLEVYWEQKPQIITCYNYGDRGVSMKLGLNSNMAMVNEELRYLDQPPIAINGRTMVPLRFISEVLGSDVSWNQKTKTVNITKKPIQVIGVKDYEKAFKEFLYDGGLHNELKKAYKTNDFPLTNNLVFSFYDIDKDGVPELVMTFNTGFSVQRAIFEYRNGKINSLYNELKKTEESGATTIYHTFYHDPIKKELYSRSNQKYTDWVERYTKQNGFKRIYEDSSVGGGETKYYDSNFNIRNIKELKMQPFHNINYHDEGHYEPI